MERIGAVVVAAALLASACTQSQVPRDADVTIRGSATHSDGQPLADTTVSVHVDPGPSILFWTPMIIGTLGLVCATDLCGADHTASTGPDGHYTFRLRGRDVQGSFGEEIPVLVDVAAPATAEEQAGPAGRLRMVVRDEHMSLPAIRLWEPEVAITDDAISWDALPADRGAPTGTRVLFQPSDGALVWQAPATATGVSIDPRILEDSAGAVAGVATLAASEPDGVSELELRTGTRRYRSQAGAPASRGQACTAVSDGGVRTPLAPCPVTDGDLVARADLSLPCPEGGPCPRTEALEVALGAERDLQLVVVRGCADCRMAAGAASAQLTETFTAVPVETRTGVVRLTGDLGDLREVSVWDAPAGGGLTAVAVDPPGPAGEPGQPQPAGGAAPGGAGGGAPLALQVLAGLLLALTTGGLLVAAVLRRQQSG